jgi:cysteinyl-tRNA synthetase
MSLHYFPDGFDIHTGGVDLIFPHHEDEIAQSEPVAGGQVVNYWVHGAHLQMDGRKMAKSTGNVVRVSDLATEGHDPLAFRFLTMSASYRAPLHFSVDVLRAAETGLNNIRRRASQLAPAKPAESAAAKELQARFEAALADDLDLPRVTALLQETLRADIEEGEKRGLLEDWDRVLDVDLTRSVKEESSQIPEEALVLAGRRDQARGAKDWTAADAIRGELEALGWSAEDTPEGTRLKPRQG